MLILHGSRNENKIALTFDDGPNPYGTRKVLDILDKHNAKATFFLIGKWVHEYPDIVNAIHREGHLIGVHGYNHSRIRNDSARTSLEIAGIVGYRPTYIRPPYGNIFVYLPEVFSRETFVVLGDVWVYDWKRPKSNAIFETVSRNTRNGSIAILHDGSEKRNEQRRCEEMIKALPSIIDRLKKYDLVRLDQMKF